MPMQTFKQYLTELAPRIAEIDQFKMAVRELQGNIGKRVFIDTLSMEGWDSKTTSKIVGQINASFGKYGWKLIGSGAAGMVFGHSNYPYVIKLFAYDTGYMSYVKWAMENQHNELVPEFKGRPVRIIDEIFAVRIEKLVEYGEAVKKVVSVRDIIKSCLKEIKFGLINHFRDAAEEDEYWDYFRDQYTPDEAEFAFFLHDYCVKHNTTPDLHLGNLMIRKRGGVVVIDPLYDRR